MAEPRELAAQVEEGVPLPSGSEERFSGYGVMGLPFASGHVLAMRRFTASSVGPDYTSVWHRDPNGRWTMYGNVPPEQSCPRYFGSEVAAVAVEQITIDWTGDRSFSVSISDRLAWDVSLDQPLAMKAMNAAAGIMPDALWRSAAVLKGMSAVAGLVLGAGRLGLAGITPNGQRFVANPLQTWSITSSSATIDGRDLGPIGPLMEQAHLGDFWIPQRGIFVLGRAFFEPFDASRHLAVTSRAEGTG